MAGSARCVPRLREGKLFETAALRLPQSLPRRRPGMRWFLNAINNVRHGEERRRRVSNHARRPCRTRLSFETNSFTRSKAGVHVTGLRAGPNRHVILEKFELVGQWVPAFAGKTKKNASA